jgi:hypothetical protein
VHSRCLSAPESHCPARHYAVMINQSWKCARRHYQGQIQMETQSRIRNLCCASPTRSQWVLRRIAGRLRSSWTIAAGDFPVLVFSGRRIVGLAVNIISRRRRKIPNHRNQRGRGKVESGGRGTLKTPGRLPRARPRHLHTVRRALRAGSDRSADARVATRGPAGQGRSARGLGVCRIFAGRRLAARRPLLFTGLARVRPMIALRGLRRGQCAGGTAAS